MPQAIVRPRSPARFSGSFLRVLSQKDGWLLFLAKDLNSHDKRSPSLDAMFTQIIESLLHG